ncbi:hypothetical protein BpHYR1_008598 [Brachionus plicatilis]|uniref:Uncharacterized protein n=1 Tax=Brachionus plicatilis TaxID=10195 RepID=A0A3M7RG87_BRAPC|nr:hypothetical protein BpHYR1_008598 [Brachionus plicatilis]
MNKKRKKVTIISDEEDEEESEIEISPLNDQKSCFKCKTSLKTNTVVLQHVYCTISFKIEVGFNSEKLE